VNAISAEGTIYGCIFGGGPRGLEMNKFFVLNKTVIEALPEKLDWDSALLTKGTFTVPMHDRDDFYRNQMIHFGASFNHLDLHWQKWLNEFEVLLRRLFWFEAHVHMEAELYGTYDYHWQANTGPMFLHPPKPIEKWEFEGGPRSFE